MFDAIIIHETWYEDLFALLALNYGELQYYLFHITLLLLCLNVALAKRNSNAVAQVTYTYGGSTLAGILLGVSPFISSNRLAIPAHICARALVLSLPADVFHSPVIQWTIKIGAELCRCAIAITWYGHAEKKFGKSNRIESVFFAVMAGSFGNILGSLSLQPLLQTTCISLFVAMILYQEAFLHQTVQDENRARSFIVIWMIWAQHILPILTKPFQSRSSALHTVKKNA